MTTLVASLTPATPLYRARVLSTEEWTAREGELIYAQGYMTPNDYRRMVVVEDADGHIVASWCAMNVVMLEGLSVTPGHPMAGKHLLLEMLHQLKDLGAAGALTRIIDPTVKALAQHAGFDALEGELFQIALTPAETT